MRVCGARKHSSIGLPDRRQVLAEDLLLNGSVWEVGLPLTMGTPDANSGASHALQAPSQSDPVTESASRAHLWTAHCNGAGLHFRPQA